MNISGYKKKATLIRDTDIYRVYDLSELEHLNLSLTELKVRKATGGHTHEFVDEVYVFITGSGIMEIGKKKEKVKEGDVVIIHRGNFHKVYNRGRKPLKFWSIFEKYEGRGKTALK
ncbi:MAG: cupin domain-containing protein [Candidatus Omnitrophica bacterium]|jgi:mannose-6-phosphate isomerase-like protein (cupin superfamily)|nr:cupin domain-containing protein [Candidatus Omnitrophota bacterium]